MHIVYHLGAHCTDEERLLRCLLKNRNLLAAEGIAVPGPARYRTMLRDAVAALDGAEAPPTLQADLLARILDHDRAERLVLSWDSFLGFPQWVLRGALYPAAAERVRGFTRLFPDHEAELHLAIRNPASFLPALFEKQRGRSYAAFIEGCEPAALRWSDVVAGIRALNPELPITLWCDEDRPLIWPEVLASVAGHSPGLELEQTDELLAELLPPEAMAALRRALAEHPAGDVEGRRRLVSASLTAAALPERLEMEVDLPGWTEALVATMTAGYETDLVRIARIPGVTVLTP
ncbi:hypothetical protein FAZ78_22365 [Cereibacter changlensis]|uniref:Uncharacterized protein n=1 Tax=Cereibacter changlensis TaxID=402884 RepID=A0A4U0YSE0_9RHOB|nr:hypothetical protein [Cereibacter changlensis]TKA94438.1 hypothetical protein FAZ78_22365 [Cereibacter changlensis]